MAMKPRNNDHDESAESSNYESDESNNTYYIDQDKLENRIEISRTQTISYYVEHCHKILRYHEDLYVSAIGTTTGIACCLCQLLEKRKIAKIASISTGLDVGKLLNTSHHKTGNIHPTPMMTFKLKGAEFGEYLIHSQQEKIIELFENNDSEISGYLSFDVIESFKFPKIFNSNKQQMQKSHIFLSEFEKERKLDLPNFIKYASILIHPLLKDEVFDRVLLTEFDIY